MKTAKLINGIAVFFIIVCLPFQVLAQQGVPTKGKVKVVRFLELHPSLAGPGSSPMSTSLGFLRNASRNLEKSIGYDRKKGIFFFRSCNGQKIQTFDLKSLGLYKVGHTKWNPDGTMLLASIGNLNKGGASSLYLLKLDGTIEEVVSVEGSVRQGVTQPCWSYDGKMFAYLKILRSGSEIWIKNLQTGKDILVERVSTYEGACVNPLWLNRHYKILYKKAKLKRPSSSL